MSDDEDLSHDPHPSRLPRNRPRAEISLRPGLSLNDWGQEPLLQSAQTYEPAAAQIDLVEKGFMSTGGIVKQDVFRGFDLQLSYYIVKPHGTVGLVIEADLQGYTKGDGSRVSADFADGNHRIASPGVLVVVIG